MSRRRAGIPPPRLACARMDLIHGRQEGLFGVAPERTAVLDEDPQRLGRRAPADQLVDSRRGDIVAYQVTRAGPVAAMVLDPVPVLAPDAPMPPQCPLGLDELVLVLRVAAVAFNLQLPVFPAAVPGLAEIAFPESVRVRCRAVAGGGEGDACLGLGGALTSLPLLPLDGPARI